MNKNVKQYILFGLEYERYPNDNPLFFIIFAYNKVKNVTSENII